MKSMLSSGQALTLYGVIVAFVFGIYLLGLQLKTTRSSPEKKELLSEAAVGEGVPVDSLQENLDFYEEVSKPVESSSDLEIQEDIPVATETQAIEGGVREDSEPGQAVEADNPLPAAEAPPTVAASKPARFTIQVAAMSTEEEANQVILRLQAKDFQGRIHPPDAAGTNDRFFRVWVGEYSSNAEAEQMLARLKDEGFLSYVRELD